MIESIIFDLGNVLLDFIPMRIYEQVTTCSKDAKTLYELFMHSGIWHELDRGKPLEEVISWTQEKAPSHLFTPIKQVVHRWHEDLTLNHSVAELVEQLKSEGYDLYVLSNISKQFYELKNRFPIFEQFDGIYISADSQLLKPEKEIYEDFLTKFHLKSESCFFIDDKPENIEGAKSVGIKGYVYNKDTDKLRLAIDNLKREP